METNSMQIVTNRKYEQGSVDKYNWQAGSVKEFFLEATVYKNINQNRSNSNQQKIVSYSQILELRLGDFVTDL